MPIVILVRLCHGYDKRAFIRLSKTQSSKAQSAGPEQNGGQSAKRWPLKGFSTALGAKAQSAGSKQNGDRSAKHWPFKGFSI